MRRSEFQSECQQRTEIFMKAAGQTIRSRPGTPDEAERKLRAKLILEEALETIDGLGCQVYDYTNTRLLPKQHDLRIEVLPAGAFDLEAAIDGFIDLIVVATGGLSMIGVDDRPHQEEVDNANLRKIGPNGVCEIRDDGKLLKPAGWVGPDHVAVLDRHFGPSQFRAEGVL
jgi:predicted HAD superfamily Cof-like phosphohydrolase